MEQLPCPVPLAGISTHTLRWLCSPSSLDVDLEPSQLRMEPAVFSQWDSCWRLPTGGTPCSSAYPGGGRPHYETPANSTEGGECPGAPYPQWDGRSFPRCVSQGKRHGTTCTREGLGTSLTALGRQVMVKMVQEPALIIEQRSRTAPEMLLSTVGPSSFDALNSAGLLSAKGANAPYVKFPVLRLDSSVLIPCLLWH